MEYISVLMGILNLVMMNPNIEQTTKDQIFSQGLVLIEQGFKVQQVEVVPAVVAPVTYSAPVETGITTENMVEYSTSTMETNNNVQYVAFRNAKDGNGNDVFQAGTIPENARYMEFTYTINGVSNTDIISRNDGEKYDSELGIYHQYGLPNGTTYTYKVWKNWKEEGKQRNRVGVELVDEGSGVVSY